MKNRKLISLILCILLVLSVSSVALASTDYGKIYDGTGYLLDSRLTSLNNSFKTFESKSNIEIRCDIFTLQSGFTSADSLAPAVYKQYEYGHGSNKDGIYLLIYVNDNGNDLSYNGYSIYLGGDAYGKVSQSVVDQASMEISDYYSSSSLNGPLSTDTEMIENAIEVFYKVMDNNINGAYNDPNYSHTVSGNDSQAQLNYVTDAAGILSSSEVSSLEDLCKSVSKSHGLSVYIVTVEDFTTIDSTVTGAAQSVFTYYDLGWGSNRDGLMLFLSMKDRDYALIAHGDYGNYSFTDYGKGKLEDKFLDDFRNNSWYNGFKDYVQYADTMMSNADKNDPIDVDYGDGSETDYFKIFLIFGVPLIVALITCSIWKAQMKTARLKFDADNYIIDNSIQFRIMRDLYSHTTRVVRHIERDHDEDHHSGGGGTTVSSDGFSSKHGKF